MSLSSIKNMFTKPNIGIKLQSEQGTKTQYFHPSDLDGFAEVKIRNKNNDKSRIVDRLMSGKNTFYLLWDAIKGLFGTQTRKEAVENIINEMVPKNTYRNQEDLQNSVAAETSALLTANVTAKPIVSKTNSAIVNKFLNMVRLKQMALEGNKGEFKVIIKKANIFFGDYFVVSFTVAGHNIGQETKLDRISEEDRKLIQKYLNLDGSIIDNATPELIIADFYISHYFRENAITTEPIHYKMPGSRINIVEKIKENLVKRYEENNEQIFNINSIFDKKFEGITETKYEVEVEEKFMVTTFIRKTILTVKLGNEFYTIEYKLFFSLDKKNILKCDSRSKLQWFNSSREEILKNSNENLIPFESKKPDLAEDFNLKEVKEFNKVIDIFKKAYDISLPKFIGKKKNELEYSYLIYKLNGMYHIWRKPNFKNNDEHDDILNGSFKNIKASGIILEFDKNKIYVGNKKVISFSKSPDYIHNNKTVKGLKNEQLKKLINTDPGYGDIKSEGFWEVEFRDDHDNKRIIYLNYNLGKPLNEIMQNLDSEIKLEIIVQLYHELFIKNGDMFDTQPIYDIKVENIVWDGNHAHFIDFSSPLFTYAAPQQIKRHFLSQNQNPKNFTDYTNDPKLIGKTMPFDKSKIYKSLNKDRNVKRFIEITQLYNFLFVCQKLFENSNTIIEFAVNKMISKITHQQANYDNFTPESLYRILYNEDGELSNNLLDKNMTVNMTVLNNNDRTVSINDYNIVGKTQQQKLKILSNLNRQMILQKQKKNI